MIGRKAVSSVLSFVFVVACFGVSALAQGKTTGRITGTVKDINGALVVGASIKVVSSRTGEQREVATSEEGIYSIPFLPSGSHSVTVSSPGFSTVTLAAVVAITETLTLDVILNVSGPQVDENFVVSAPPFTQVDGPQLGRVVNSRAVSELPLATRNFTQILALSPGTSVELADNSAVGRNSQNISVNGARTNQNNYQINGADANYILSNNAVRLAVPAPETIQEFKVQTSLYDAIFGRSGGGNVQAVTKSGANDFHGGAYEYFLNDALNANNPFLKAAGTKRPVLRRNIFGGLIGGHIKKDKAFFFASYQGTRERNGASVNSLSSSVLITPNCCLTDDRSESTLRQTFNVPPINPVSLKLLNARLPSGHFLIPTPRVNGRYSGSAISPYREDQFNANMDYRISEKDWLATRFFFSNAPQSPALFGGPNAPGFGAEQTNNNRLVSLQEIHTFSPTAINEARFGYNFIRQVSLPREPVNDSDMGISRANASAVPGLALIRIAPNAGGIVFGTATTIIDQHVAAPSTTLADVLSITRSKHSVRMGTEVIYYQVNVESNFSNRGQIDFNTFNDFLAGTVSQSVFGTGINYRSLRATDYNLFAQDDWKFSRKLTLNLGLRYELDLPPYDTRGRLATFDPAFYQPRLLVVGGIPRGPPIGGFVQAGNAILQYDLPDVPNVGKRVVTSSDPNNLAPRIGFAYSPLNSGRLVVRGGFGIFYSRTAATHLGNAITLPPNYVIGRRSNPSFADPYFLVPSADRFPIFVPTVDLADQVFDRKLRTPYFQQYNMSVQHAIRANLLLEVSYVGGRGLNLFRNVGINQARLASPQKPIINEVLHALGLPGDVITTNTPANAQLRAPFQGVSTNSFGQRQTTAQSSYNSLQVSLTRRLSSGLQLLGSYTYAKSIDNASGGAFGTGQSADSGFILGNQLDNRANRGVSDFDRTHRFVLSYLWELPRPVWAKGSTTGRLLLSNWQFAGIITAMSGLPIDILDTGAGSLYGLSGGGSALARPNWAPGETRSTATSNIPAGYLFNPRAFARPVVPAGQLIPSSNGVAVAGATCGQPNVVCTDIGNVGRNVLRGPRQTNVDFSIIKRFPMTESKNIEFRAEFFNLFNHVNFANPISNLNAVQSSGGSIDANGRITNPGDFGRIISTSNNPRLIQFVLKFNF